MNLKTPFYLFLGLVCFLQMAAQTAQAQELKDYQGIVTQDIKLWSGASTKSYQVGQLKKGTLVHVIDMNLKHYRITAPQGVASYIRVTDVTRIGATHQAKVNVKWASVRVANINGPALSKKTHKTLNMGDTVTIIQTDGLYYKIKTPPNAPVYIRPNLIRPATANEIAQGGAVQEVVAVKPTTPASKKTTTIGSTISGVAKAKTTGAEGSVVVVSGTKKTVNKTVEKTTGATATKQAKAKKAPKATSLKLQAIEDQFIASQEMALLSRPFDKLIAAYQNFAKKNKLGRIDAYIVKFRVRILRYQQRRARMIQRIQAAINKSKPTCTQRQLLADIRHNRKIRYHFTGIIMPSTVYNGKKMPRYFRLVDPTDNRTLAYIEPNSVLVPQRHLGLWVGIVGKKHAVKGILNKIITPTQIDVLEPATKKAAGQK